MKNSSSSEGNENKHNAEDLEKSNEVCSKDKVGNVEGGEVAVLVGVDEVVEFDGDAC